MIAGISLECLRKYFGMVYSPDSYAYLLIGSNFWSGHGFSTPSIRDFYMPLSGGFLEESRSFPPAIPFLIGLFELLFSTGIASGFLLNVIIVIGLNIVFAQYLYRKVDKLPLVIFLLLPLLVIKSSAFKDEIVSGRSIPLSLLLVLVLLSLYSKEILSKNKAVFTGIVLGLLYLNRFDSIIFCLLFLGWLLRKVGARIWFVSILAFLGTILPWLIRNVIKFGTPFASDNSLTAMSTFQNIVPISFFSDKVPMIFDNVDLWVNQRIDYFIVNLNMIGFAVADICGVLSPLVFILFITSFFKPQGTQFLRPIAVIWIVSNLVGISLTPYHDMRYFVISAFLIVVTAAISLLQFIDFRLPSVVKRKSLFTLKQSLLSLALAGGILYHFKSDFFQDDLRAGFINAAISDFKSKIPANSLIASEIAEPIAYRSGWKTIYLPINIEKFDDQLVGYLNRFKVDFIMVAENSKLAQSARPPVLAQSNGFVLFKSSEVSP